MTLFQLVKVALDALYEEASHKYGKGVDNEIVSRFSYLTTSYKDLSNNGRNPLNYKDPATRFAYVYKYVASHGDYIVQLLRIVREELGAVFKDKTARVTCIGGGPGSDILAVLKYLSDYSSEEPVAKVVCYLLDKEQAWADTWTELDDKLDLSRINLNVNFQPLDVTEPDSWASQRKFLEADLFTLSYFVSEVYALDEGVVGKFWATLFEEAKPGALFLYDDNGTEVFNNYFDQHWNAAGLELLKGSTNTQLTPSSSEQASELAMYKDKFGENPKLKSLLSYRILRKET
ncbi:MAG: hypothetical protein KIT73_05410 [Burkholderiales bacterium]|nr:hypothetical protein [Burkholderiales bacterium]